MPSAGFALEIRKPKTWESYFPSTPRWDSHLLGLHNTSTGAHTCAQIHTQHNRDCGWHRRSYRLREGEKGRKCGGRYSLRGTPLPQFLRWYPTYACGLLQEVHAGIIPIAQARHRPSLTGTTDSLGSKTGKMETCVRARGVSKLGPWLHPDLP